MAFMLLTAISGCSGPAEQTNLLESEYEGYDLVKADSIGVELGDSNYVFGAIIDAAYLNDGRIALLDVMQRKIHVFSNNGVFLSAVGREGMGPGEFTAPYSLTALSNGGFAVSDVQQGKVVFFSAALEPDRELTGFTPMAPTHVRIGPDGSIIGRRTNWYMDEEAGVIYSGSEYARWSDSISPDLIYREDYAPHSSDARVYCGIASSVDGRLFAMPSSRTEYSITGYSPSGDVLFRVELPWDTVLLTEDELLAARPHLIVPGPGSESTSSELSANWTPDSTRNSGYPVGIDDSGRLWVKSGRGATASPTFDLFDSEDGSYLGMISTTLPAIARFWSYRVCDQGILGWDHNPDDFPRIYILKLVYRDGT